MWVAPGHPTKLSYQGLVVDWRLVNRTWMALVVYVDDQSTNDRRTVLRWMRPETLVPCPQTPTRVARANARGMREQMASGNN